MELKRRYRWILVFRHTVGIQTMEKHCNMIKSLVNDCGGEVQKLENLGMKKYKTTIQAMAQYVHAYFYLPDNRQLKASLQKLQKSLQQHILKQMILLVDHQEDFSHVLKASSPINAAETPQQPQQNTV